MRTEYVIVSIIIFLVILAFAMSFASSVIPSFTQFLQIIGIVK
jgi:Na+-transporting methylmalonyl-CoA/oxaloacetate decarboxylase gamma subunit